MKGPCVTCSGVTQMTAWAGASHREVGQHCLYQHVMLCDVGQSRIDAVVLVCLHSRCHPVVDNADADSWLC